ncbi:MAG: hypothetical protein V1870_02635 [Candidatus Aenigmatarchaeota archaeon]
MENLTRKGNVVEKFNWDVTRPYHCPVNCTHCCECLLDDCYYEDGAKCIIPVEIIDKYIDSMIPERIKQWQKKERN